MYGNPMGVKVKVAKPMQYEELEAWARHKAISKGVKIDPEDFAAFDIDHKVLKRWLKEEGYDAIDYSADPYDGVMVCECSTQSKLKSLAHLEDLPTSRRCRVFVPSYLRNRG